MKQIDLTNQFLIAMPNLKSLSFEKTVTYICAHNEDGAMGIVINKPTDIELGDILEKMDIPSEHSTSCHTKKVLQGGPVHTDRGFILHQATKKWNASMIVSEQISVTTSKDILEAIASGNGPDQALIALGYASWDNGQLEQELMDNVWLSGPADYDIIFNTPAEKCWQTAAHHLGIDLNRLSSDIGHA